jgi:hypothetical protein
MKVRKGWKRFEKVTRGRTLQRVATKVTSRNF